MDYNEIHFSELPGPFLKIESKNELWSRILNKGLTIHLPDGFRLFVRWMQYQDIPYVCEIEKQIFPSPWQAESFLYELGNRNYNISFVGLIGKKIVTYSTSYVVYDEFHISNIAVVPDSRRIKIGETMLTIALKIAMKKKCQIAHLEVRKSNVPAIALYQKHGFQAVGVRKNYYQNENEDALLMTKQLSGENIHGVV